MIHWICVGVVGSFTIEADPFKVQDTNMLKHLVWLHLNMQILVSQPKNRSEYDVNVDFMLSLLLIYQLNIPSKHRLIHQLFVIQCSNNYFCSFIDPGTLLVCLYISLELQITLLRLVQWVGHSSLNHFSNSFTFHIIFICNQIVIYLSN